MVCKILLRKVTSTQDFAEAVASMIEGEFVVIAEEQTRARGRMRRKWFSPRGGLWVTYVKRSFPVEEVPFSTLKVALAIVEILDELNPRIRWPNDIVVNDKKISGILIEANVSGNNNKADLFIGFGIDTEVKDFPPDIKATSYYLETGKLFQKSIEEIIETINSWLSKDNEQVISRVNEVLSLKDREVLLETKDGEKKCKALFVDYLGRLVTECGIFEVQDIERVDVL
ncbi:biotin--[acetyl-CoA-carboxylase] ligase [Sulfuracidifex metallicus]|uniref:biotin--[acetyl-CoA-carboxylase] ligase n=1 Tax=Sulfuracidifex metallicus TaxID=47303 RepID=UPI0012DEFA56|nr:biotin--[acetyl-CoA-carboxylase] ligase [Sulfuracidifex metallicus]WOE51259.1 biotin--[acetyl-CoA-carboxylase] ligase [Sulfuracidifex metallicus DSM 6482 = JCM 9184]